MGLKNISIGTFTSSFTRILASLFRTLFYLHYVLVEELQVKLN